VSWLEEVTRASRSLAQVALSSWSGLARVCILLLSLAIAGAVFLAVFDTIRNL
jgi:hypothetical protein